MSFTLLTLAGNALITEPRLLHRAHLLVVSTAKTVCLFSGQERMDRTGQGQDQCKARSGDALSREIKCFQGQEAQKRLWTCLNGAEK